MESWVQVGIDGASELLQSRIASANDDSRVRLAVLIRLLPNMLRGRGGMPATSRCPVGLHTYPSILKTEFVQVTVHFASIYAER